MKSKVVSAVLMAALCSAYGATVRTATEGFVTNRIAAAIAAIPAPDYSPTNAELRATIEAVAPVSGDYATVSNRAMNAVQTTDMDWLDAESKMGAITASGDVFFPWRFLGSAFLADELVWPGDGFNYHLVYDESAKRWITWYAPPGSEDMIDEETGRFLTQKDIAFLSDIPESVTPSAVTNIIRELSLGGIWDAGLEVWWTPVMVGGSLTYQATTNVNLNAEN